MKAAIMTLALSDNYGAAMRAFVWKDLLQVTQMYGSPWLIPHAIGCVIGIYAVCAFLDFLRIRLIETPFFKLWDKVWPKIERGYMRIENWSCKKWNIKE